MDGIRPMASVSWSTIKFSPWLTSMYQTDWKMINLVFYQKWKDTCTLILTSHPSTVQVKDCIEHTITGRMWVICPVSSNTITDVEMVCVTAADMAAAPVYHKTKTVGTYNYDQLFPWKLKEMTKSLGVEWDPARVNSDKRHDPKSSDSELNEIATRDNLPWPNCDSDGKVDNKRHAFINTHTRCFKIQIGDMGPPPLAGPLESSGIQDYLDPCASKEPINSCPERIHHFLWCMWS